MTDVEIVIPRFGHYVNFALTVAAVPGGLRGGLQMYEKGLIKVLKCF